MLFSREYRRIKIARFLDRCLRRFDPRIKFIGVETNSELQFMFLGDQFVTPHILCNGDFQKKDVLRAVALLEQEGLPLGKAFVDIGANIGTSTIYAMGTGKFARALCIEPVRSNVKLLKINLAANNLSATTTTIQAAVSNKTKTGEILLSPSNTGDNRLSVNNEQRTGQRTGETADWSTETVHFETLADIASANNINAGDVSLIWIDTQGHEGYVLDGSQEFLKQGIPICLEFWPRGLEESGSKNKLFELLQRHYKFYVDLSDSADEKHTMTTLPSLYDRLAKADHHTDIVVLPN